MLPKTVRGELGHWSGAGESGGGRLGCLPNRYSRSAERVLSIVLRSFPFAHIASRAARFGDPTLADLTATPAEVSRMNELWEEAVERAKEVG